MNIVEHVSFDQLPPACKCLLSIAAMAANLKTDDKRRQSYEALASTIRGFWNESRLAPFDLRDLSGITARLCTWIKSARATHN